jgi:hypothetical protein
MNNDVIERMLIAFYPRFKTGTQFSEINRIGMTAAARVLLDEVLPDPLPAERVRKFNGWNTEAAIRDFARDCRAKIERPKTLEDRVTVSDRAGHPFAVMIDGSLRRGFGNREDAEVFRLGLIAKMKEEGK